MLVLSRKTGERIHIGDNITIEIRRVAGNRVTLALEAPRTVRILRGELNQAAREFRDAAEFHNGAEFEISTTGEGANGHHEISEYAVASENDAEPGPEPYAVIHRRLHVLPTLSPQPISHPAVT